jgi:hypothetical protein
MSSKLDFAELVEIFPSSNSMVGVVHPHVFRWFTAMTRYLEIGAIPSLKDVYFRVVDLGINGIVCGTIFGTEMFRTDARS